MLIKKIGGRIMSEVVWNKYSKEEFNDVMKFSDGYIDFLSDSKTERACVQISNVSIFIQWILFKIQTRTVNMST